MELSSGIMFSLLGHKGRCFDVRVTNDERKLISGQFYTKLVNSFDVT